ncbi:MAG TPA: hypothetical protein VFV92_03710, partial [Candidatus Bathyarchaeia archaeon]|nr:hypothetical protein [Candidatus Bathyarchaeia archaeon]
RGFVIEFVGDVQKPIQQQLQSSNEILRDIQIEAFEGKLDANKDAVAKWSLEKDKAADPNTKNMIDQHIKELVSSGDRLKGQLDNLRMLKAKAH